MEQPKQELERPILIHVQGVSYAVPRQFFREEVPSIVAVYDVPREEAFELAAVSWAARTQWTLKRMLHEDPVRAVQEAARWN